MSKQEYIEEINKLLERCWKEKILYYVLTFLRDMEG